VTDFDIKYCGKCDTTKFTDEFNNSVTTKDGKQTCCRSCSKAYNKANKVKIAAKRKEYYADNSASLLKNQKEYYQNNREKRLDYARKTYTKNALVLTHDRAVELLKYEPSTGSLTWISSGKEAGTMAGNGYKIVTVDTNKYMLHRVIWLIQHGEFPENIDHINGDRIDNRLVNLRSVSTQENLKNRKIGSANTSGIMGVQWDKARNAWNVYIGLNKKNTYIGRFNNIFDAAAARKAAEIEHGFHPNHGRI